ncbi:MAG: prolyl oligopeptidase family serine peptidase [Verrucomicrobiae bacterium]|nr:prolyl oligopeptidase family serine peptidase [Verrucomicrobiae bacterium]
MAITSLSLSADVTGYPEGVSEIRYPVAADASEQPALYWAPVDQSRPVPLLVALHTWSSDYRQAGGESLYAKWCQQQGWAFIHPNFRGPNRTPEALGSDLMVADIVAAVDYAKSHAKIDETRIYAIGVSGGGHATQLLAGRTPEIWAGISSWCGIADIAAWHAETLAAGRGRYAKDIEGALGGSPDDSTERAADAKHRSPLTWLANASGVPLDINAGVNDGRSGSVPFSHSLHAWNAVVPAEARLPGSVIEAFYDSRKAPEGMGESTDDVLYGKRPPVFRLTKDNTRVTIFEGGHEIIHEAALNWLAAQRKGQPANWHPSKIGTLQASDADTQSGK